ncbi:hypothetical protein [Zavarzinella formosa]|uniref:hypothetical protein n=1 Tax=Zavarzinella formosa TaxID=360055 RepID=UPI00030082EB|nr:hypothetical protein [Zavarzinella formosa]
MSKPKTPTTAETAAELARVQAEPLLPIEKQLIAGSLILGVVLLGILYRVSQTYFPTG